MFYKDFCPVCGLFFHSINNVSHSRSFLILVNSTCHQFFFPSWILLFVLYLKVHFWTQCHLGFILYFLLEIKCFAFYIKICSWGVNFCKRCKFRVSVDFFFFCLWTSRCSSAICWEDYFFPPMGFHSYFQNQLNVFVWVYFWTPCSGQFHVSLLLLHHAVLITVIFQIAF